MVHYVVLKSSCPTIAPGCFDKMATVYYFEFKSHESVLTVEVILPVPERHKGNFNKENGRRRERNC